MEIQFNTDKNINGNEELTASLNALAAKELNRFSEQITRLEIHLSDEDSSKDGINDKRCLIEARLEGLKPIAVTNQANSDENAVKGAIDKLKSSLETTLGRQHNY
jgi:ribosome-associated translation inhibitor RaiA